MQLTCGAAANPVAVMRSTIRGDNPWMNRARKFCCRVSSRLAFAGLVFMTASCFLLNSARGAENREIRIIELQGTVEIMPAHASTWVLTQTNQVLHPGDRARTGADSRV